MNETDAEKRVERLLEKMIQDHLTAEAALAGSQMETDIDTKKRLVKAAVRFGRKRDKT